MLCTATTVSENTVLTGGAMDDEILEMLVDNAYLYLVIFVVAVVLTYAGVRFFEELYFTWIWSGGKKRARKAMKELEEETGRDYFNGGLTGGGLDTDDTEGDDDSDS